MWDKMYTYLLIVFIFIGILAYERHIVNQGKMGIVSKIVDYVGIANFESPYGNSFKSFSESYNFDFKNLDRLARKYHAIEDQRETLVEHRKQILQAINDLNIDIYEEGLIYKDVIFQERDAFFAAMPNMKDFGDRLTAARNEPDPVIKQQLYNQLEQDMITFLATIVDDPVNDVPRLQNLFSSIQDIINEIPDVLIQRCAGIELYECIRNSPNIEQDLAEMIHTIASAPNPATIDAFTDLLFQEYFIQSARLEQYEIDENEQEVESEFKRLVMLLDDVQQQDLNLLNGLYDTLVADQDVLMMYLKLHEKLSSDKLKTAFNTYNNLRLPLYGVESSNIRSRAGGSIIHLAEKIEKQEEAITNVVYKIHQSKNIFDSQLENVIYEKRMQEMRTKDIENTHNKESKEDFIRTSLQSLRDARKDLGY